MLRRRIRISHGEILKGNRLARLPKRSQPFLNFFLRRRISGVGVGQLDGPCNDSENHDRNAYGQPLQPFLFRLFLLVAHLFISRNRHRQSRKTGVPPVPLFPPSGQRIETGKMPVLRYHFNSCNRRATSSAFARLLNALMRKYPSPFEPKPLPGVITTLASLRILSNTCQLVTPCGVRTQM